MPELKVGFGRLPNVKDKLARLETAFQALDVSQQDTSAESEHLRQEGKTTLVI